jgi:hypothetical protein
MLPALRKHARRISEYRSPVGVSHGRQAVDPLKRRPSERFLFSALDDAAKPIAQDVFDLATHLIATHHGRGRPHFPKRASTPIAKDSPTKSTPNPSAASHACSASTAGGISPGWRTFSVAPTHKRSRSDYQTMGTTPEETMSGSSVKSGTADEAPASCKAVAAMSRSSISEMTAKECERSKMVRSSGTTTNLASESMPASNAATEPMPVLPRATTQHASANAMIGTYSRFPGSCKTSSAFPP